MTGASVDVREFARFILTGIVGTIGNLGAVWLSGYVLPFTVALVVGSAAGLMISFLMSKLFAFRSLSWGLTYAEMVRFLIVYAAGSAIYWGVGFYLGGTVFPAFLNQRLAEVMGALVGASTMTFTSYFGHRFFTYQTFRNHQLAPHRDVFIPASD